MAAEMPSEGTIILSSGFWSFECERKCETP